MISQSSGVPRPADESGNASGFGGANPDLCVHSQHVVASVLARASERYDPRLDPECATNWADALARYRFTVEELTAAVDDHYQNRPRDTLLLGDLIAAARAVRADRLSRASRMERETRQVEIDERHGLESPPPRRDFATGPVLAAYEVNEAITRPCPVCGAGIGMPCTNLRTNTRRMSPCPPRVFRDRSVD